MRAVWILMVASVAAWGQGGAIKNPRTAKSDVEAGGRIYRSHCAECHGLKGEGGRGPDLTRGEYRHGSSDGALFKTIDDGIPGTQMPGVYFEDVQVWQVVAFVRTLASGGDRHKVNGDREAGERIFFGKGGCGACHMVNGRGGRMGPDLSVIGTMRNPAHLRKSLLEPSAELPMEWWSVTATDRGGREHHGLRLNEDTYTIQIRDGRQELVSLTKAELRSLTVEKKKSTMPGYEGKLTSVELDDVLAYLYSLQRKAREE